MSQDEQTTPASYKRILVVDDEEQVVFVLHNSLKKLGAMYEIVTARNGQEALDKIEQAPVDLLVTDLAMPDMDGVALTEAVRTQAPHTKIVWVSAHSQWAGEAERLGVRRYILKPLDVAEIRRVVREELEASPPPPPTPLQGKILIMEDTDDLRRLYSKTLAKAGYQVFPAATIREARELLAQHRFDVFMCDIRMGSEGLGTDLLREQLDALRALGTEIIMVSAEARYRDLCEEMGIEFYIEKPVALPPLITLVNRLLTR